MLGEVAHCLRALAGRRRVAAAGVAAAALIGAGGISAAHAQILPPLPVPTPTPGICILIVCNPLGDGTQSTPTPTPSPSCAVTCLPSVNPTCNVTTDPTCVIGNGQPTPCQSNCGGGGHTPQTSTSTTSTSSHSRSATTSQSLFGAGNGGDPGITGRGGSVAVPVGVSVATVPTVEQLGPASGFQFGHAPILWPLFGILDLLGLVAVVTVFRRLRSAEPD